MLTTRFAAVLALGMALATAQAQADQTITPDWMKVDAASKTVTLDMVAGWNPDNGALNYNGYSQGQISIVVPAGWRVKATMLNHDGMLPHSMLVTKRYDETDTPEELGTPQVAVSKAYTDNPIGGTAPNEKDSFDFRAPSDAESLWFVCGVPGHALQGMHVDLTIDPAATAPVLIVHDPAAKGRT